jgi:hypothetical protein
MIFFTINSDFVDIIYMKSQIKICLFFMLMLSVVYCGQQKIYQKPKPKQIHKPIQKQKCFLDETCELAPKERTVIKIGLKGPKGDNGDNGAQGEDGNRGCVGPQGPDGIQGQPGIQGPPGNQGPIGPVGPIGETGPQGPPGLPIPPTSGPLGQEGEQGPPGQVGPVGPQGPNGRKCDLIQPVVITKNSNNKICWEQCLEYQLEKIDFTLDITEIADGLILCTANGGYSLPISVKAWFELNFYYSNAKNSKKLFAFTGEKNNKKGLTKGSQYIKANECLENWFPIGFSQAVELHEQHNNIHLYGKGTKGTRFQDLGVQCVFWQNYVDCPLPL